MVKKIAYVGVIALFITSLMSCEDDYTEVGSSIINNTKFDIKEQSFDVSLTEKDLKAVQTDNISLPVSEYLLGIYKSDTYKDIKASIVSQLVMPTNLKNTSTKDSTYILDKVLIKIPYQVTAGDNKTLKLASVLGNTAVETKLKVLLNETYLYKLNPNDVKNNEVYYSDKTYNEGENLTEGEEFKFTPKATDIAYTYESTKVENGNIKQTQDTLKLKSGKPFLAIPLDTQKMKTLFWEKFTKDEFKSKEAFENYCKGLIIKTVSNDGSLLSFDFDKFGKPSLEFCYTIICKDKGINKSSIKGHYSFPFGAITTNIYEMSPVKPAPNNSITIQGTAGSIGEVKLFTDEQLQQLRSKNILINDAVLSFYVNESTVKDVNLLPKRLLLFEEAQDNNPNGVHISDAYMTPLLYGGLLEHTENKPLKYTFRITNYLTKLISDKNEKNKNLNLKVFNTFTDASIKDKKILDTIVRTYNSNPKGVTLYNGELSNKGKRVELKIYYTKQK